MIQARDEMIKSIRQTGAWMSLILISGCMSFGSAHHQAACTQVSGMTLRLEGYIDEEMEACASAMLTPEVTRVVVDSPGGLTGPGRSVGRKIAEVPRTLVIDGRCTSSCGNYFVPAAARLQITPGSYIGLHGTPDPGTDALQLAQQRADWDAAVAAGVITPQERATEEAIWQANSAAIFADENALAAEFGIRPGWRLYRAEGCEDPALCFLVHFTGTLRPRETPLRGQAMMVVEPDMLESCLPRLDPGNYRAVFETTVSGDPQRKAEIEAANGLFSGTLACKPPEETPNS